MRLKGTIVQWNDDRGFGFIEPAGGGSQVFCHVKSFAVRVRRPIAGDSVIYETSKAQDGRLSALRVRPAGLEQASYYPNIKSKKDVNRDEVDQPRSGFSRALLAWALLLALLLHASVAALIFVGRVPFPIIFLYLGMSSITILAYMIDKSNAMNRRWRTKEATLHLMELAGGWPGAFIAQQLFRHKSRKGSYQVVFWFCATVNVAGLLLYSFPEWRSFILAT